MVETVMDIAGRKIGRHCPPFVIAEMSGNHLLKCTSTYPATAENTNILTIPRLRELFGCAGLSDHTMGVGVSVAGVALGATVIEKHFTLNRADGGVDSSFSMQPGC